MQSHVDIENFLLADAGRRTGSATMYSPSTGAREGRLPSEHSDEQSGRRVRHGQ